ncbi:MAG: hypothetical protein ACFCVH_13645 [Alphaproteobacteria bacterium]
MTGWRWPDYRGLYAYPWDVALDGADRVLEDLREIGANTLTLAASYHAGRFTRPHGNGPRIYEVTDGTVYFRPDMASYGAIKPIVNPQVDSADIFAELGKQSETPVVAWTVCLHNTALGERHPEFVSRNAFGDPYTHSLDPAYPEVRDYVRALACDIAQTGVTGILLETPGYQPYVHGRHHEFALLPQNPWMERLLALSFSDGVIAGAEAAGIPAVRLRDQAHGWLEGYFASDLAPDAAAATEWILADVISDPDWAAFLKWRCRLITQLVSEIRDAMPASVWLGVIPTVQRPTAASWVEGSDLRGLSLVCDVLEIPAYHATAEAIDADLADVRRRIGGHARLHAILRPDTPDLRTEAAVRAAATAARRHGAAGLAYYNYGHLRRPALARAQAGFEAFAE